MSQRAACGVAVAVDELSAGERQPAGPGRKAMGGRARLATSLAGDVRWTATRSRRHAVNTCAAIALRHSSGVKPNGPISER